jgi:radical SAM superfamily enzyme YgiQ (UPF0313 family)
MPDIVLTTLNARYAHCSFGLRYLMANLGPLSSRARMREFVIGQSPRDVAEALLAENPRIIGIGVYIWNAVPSAQLVAVLKRVAPQVVVVVGGPEVSHETRDQRIVQLADYVVVGEGEVALPRLCEAILGGDAPNEKVVQGGLPDVAALALPYGPELYTDQDIAHREVYVEASRGCPFRCEFCLSALDKAVRRIPLDTLLAGLEDLIARGRRQFKFVDRTFNLDLATSAAILEFFLGHLEAGTELFVHFEMIPDRLPEGLRALIRRFPPGSLQFEVGIQTFNPEVAAHISRRQHYGRLADNLAFLRDETGVHVHADLIAGLPGEDLESFASGFDQLVGMGPQEVQLGILKRLRGTPIIRHTEAFSLVFSPEPPYEILSTSHLDFPTLQRVGRMAQIWDRISNSGNFTRTTPALWGDGSAFCGVIGFSDWVFATLGRTHSIALNRLAQALFDYLTGDLGRPADAIGLSLAQDLLSGGRRGLPSFLEPWRVRAEEGHGRGRGGVAPSRQARHLT